MKKSVFRITLLLLCTNFLFTGCPAFIGSLLDSLSCPVNSVYIYPETNYYSDKSNFSMTEGDELTFCAEIEYVSNFHDDLTIYVESEDESVVKVKTNSPVYSSDFNKSYKTSNADVFTFKLAAVGKGKTKVKVYVKNFEDTLGGCDVISINVSPEKTVHITNTEGQKISSIEMYKGKTYQLMAQNDYNSKSVIWRSSDTSKVTVNNGLVTAKGYGTATITLYSSDYNKASYCTVTVIDTRSWKINITNAGSIPQNFYPGDTCQLEYTLSNVTCEDKSISWKTDNPYVVSIDSNGKIKALTEGTANIWAYLNDDNTVQSNKIEIKVSKTPIACNQFFWGKWIRMDNGQTYEFEETAMKLNESKKQFLQVYDDHVVVEDIGIFTKEEDSDRILIWHDEINDIDIPLYRQGGTNLKYKLRVVGFEDEIGPSANIGRAAGTGAGGLKGKGGLKVKGTSEKYPDYKDESETDSDGYVELEAPVQGDVETIIISDEENNEIITVPGLRIDNDGANMGVIPIVGKDEYSLKITGTIIDGLGADGYLYAGADKKYKMELTITNISGTKSETSSCNIYSNDSNVVLEKAGSSIYELDNYGITQLNPGATKTIELYVSYKDLSKKCIDTEIQIEITNTKTKRKWIDYVPLRFFADRIPITIAAQAAEESNTIASLNGFLIYPDGNSQFFAVKTGTDKTVYIPSFEGSEVCKMVFSGATTTGIMLKDSNEMFYSVAFNSNVKKEWNHPDILAATDFGEPNEKETNAYSIGEDFEAYLTTGDIDFYNISIDY